MAEDAAAPIRLRVGDTAPDFRLTAADGSTVALRDFTGSSVLLYAYPAAMTPGCTKQACDFRDNLALLAGAGIAVLGISPDPVERLARFVAQEGLTFPLLSDPDRAVLRAYGAFGEKQLYGRTVTGVIRSTFVIDAAGTVTHALYAVKATGHVARLLRDLDLAAPAA